jgi:uncharacterized protein (TIGR02118 family)
MAKLLALYKKPTDTAAFDSYYFATHVPLAKTIPGLRSYEVNDGPLGSPLGEPPYYLAAVLTFDSAAAVQLAMGTREGQAVASDLANFAQAGVDLLIFDTKEV